jgi:hypothetical protein
MQVLCPTWSRAAERLDAHVITAENRHSAAALASSNYIELSNIRINHNLRERSVPPPQLIIRTHPDQPVHTSFASQPPVHAVPLAFQDCMSVPRRHGAGGGVYNVHRAAAATGPFGVHAQQHAGPVRTICSSGTREHFYVTACARGTGRLRTVTIIKKHTMSLVHCHTHQETNKSSHHIDHALPTAAAASPAAAPTAPQIHK